MFCGGTTRFFAEAVIRRPRQPISIRRIEYSGKLMPDTVPGSYGASFFKRCLSPVKFLFWTADGYSWPPLSWQKWCGTTRCKPAFTASSTLQHGSTARLAGVRIGAHLAAQGWLGNSVKHGTTVLDGTRSGQLGAQRNAASNSCSCKSIQRAQPKPPSDFTPQARTQ